MYFSNVICTVALATLASAAVAKQIPTPYSSNEVYDDAVEDSVFEREAEAEAARTAAWEQAHGGAAPSYHYGEEHDAAAWHVARDAEAEPGWKNAHDGQPPAWLAHLKSKASEAVKHVVPTGKVFTKQSGGLNLKKHHGKHGNHAHTRGVDDESEDDEILYARDFNDPIPDFSDEEVDTSLDGLLEARDAEDENDDEEEPSNPDLSGYDEDILQRRSDGTDDEIDYSLQGYLDEDDDEELSPLVQARSLNEDQEYDDYLESEEHRSLLEKIGVTKRDAEDDEQDEEEFDDEVFARSLANDENDDYEDFPDLSGDVDFSSEGDLATRDVEEEDDIPDYADVDTSLEGLENGPIFARGADDEELEDSDDVDGDADAAYADAEVAEELVAPVLG